MALFADQNYVSKLVSSMTEIERNVLRNKVIKFICPRSAFRVRLLANLVLADPVTFMTRSVDSLVRGHSRSVRQYLYSDQLTERHYFREFDTCGVDRYSFFAQSPEKLARFNAIETGKVGCKFSTKKPNLSPNYGNAGFIPKSKKSSALVTIKHPRTFNTTVVLTSCVLRWETVLDELNIKFRSISTRDSFDWFTEQMNKEQPVFPAVLLLNENGRSLSNKRRFKLGDQTITIPARSTAFTILRCVNCMIFERFIIDVDNPNGICSMAPNIHAKNTWLAMTDSKTKRRYQCSRLALTTQMLLNSGPIPHASDTIIVDTKKFDALLAPTIFVHRVCENEASLLSTLKLCYPGFVNQTRQAQIDICTRLFLTTPESFRTTLEQSRMSTTAISRLKKNIVENKCIVCLESVFNDSYGIIFNCCQLLICCECVKRINSMMSGSNRCPACRQVFSFDMYVSSLKNATNFLEPAENVQLDTFDPIYRFSSLKNILQRDHSLRPEPTPEWLKKAKYPYLLTFDQVAANCGPVKAVVFVTDKDVRRTIFTKLREWNRTKTGKDKIHAKDYKGCQRAKNQVYNEFKNSNLNSCVFFRGIDLKLTHDFTFCSDVVIIGASTLMVVKIMRMFIVPGRIRKSVNFHLL